MTNWSGAWSFFLGMVYQHTLAIGGDVEGYADSRRSGVEQTLGRTDFDLRRLSDHGANEDIVSKILEEQFLAASHSTRGRLRY